MKHIVAALLLASPVAPVLADGLGVVSEHSFTVFHLDFQYCAYGTCAPVAHERSASGTFAGVDRNGDGALSHDELTSFHVNWGLLDGAQSFYYSPSTGLSVDATSYDGRTWMHTGRSLGYANPGTQSYWWWSPQTTILVAPSAVVPEPTTQLLWICAGSAFLAFHRKLRCLPVRLPACGSAGPCWRS